MEQRVSDELLADLIAEHNPNIIRVADWCQLDLKDCRAEIKRLEAIVESAQASHAAKVPKLEGV